jgi:CRP/FNR family transcriptional regulator, cyclic AMP receptor protein
LIESPAAGPVLRGEETALSWDFFSNLPEERNAFFQIARQRRVNRKEILFREGDPANSVLYIAEGEVIITRVSSGGKEVVLYIHKKGALIGALAAVLGLPRNSTEQSIAPGIVFEAPGNHFKALIARFPKLNERLLLQLYGSLDFVTSARLSAFSDNAEIRLTKLLASLFSEALLESKPDSPPESISLNITQDQLACAIGISREMISRLLSRMQAERLIEKSAHRISFLKPDHFLRYLEIIPTHTNRQASK